MQITSYFGKVADINVGLVTIFDQKYNKHAMLLHQNNIDFSGQMV